MLKTVSKGFILWHGIVMYCDIEACGCPYIISVSYIISFSYSPILYQSYCQGYLFIWLVYSIFSSGTMQILSVLALYTSTFTTFCVA